MSRQNQPDFLNQGKQLYNNIKQKIQEGFENRKGDNYKNGANYKNGDNYREGFYGVSSTDMDASINILNAADRMSLDAVKGTFDRYTTTLSSAKTALNTKIGFYAANMKNNINYNLFSNRLLDYSDISMNGSGQCVNSSLLTQGNSGFTMNPGFNTAYPTPAGMGAVNFASFNDAKNACQTWAYDDKKQLFGLTKRTGGGYNCYTATTSPTGPQPAYVTEKVAYSLASSYDATLGGFFSNGQIGIYNGNPRVPNTVFVAGYNGVSSCGIWNGGIINPTTISASYGRNCDKRTGDVSPQKVQYVIVSPGSQLKKIQISQIVVLAYVNGISVNVAIKTANSHPNYAVKTKNGTGAEVSNSANALTAVDGKLEHKDAANCFVSSSTSLTNYWKLNLGKEYDVYQVIYYNRGDCCQDQSNGLKIILKNSAENVVAEYTLNSDRVQPFIVDTSIHLTPTVASTGAAISYTMLSTDPANRIYSSVYSINGRDILGSSVTNNIYSNSVINSSSGWLSAPTSQPNQAASAQTATPLEYITLNLQTAKNIAGIVIQPFYDTKSYVKSFKVQYWDLTAIPQAWKYVTANGMPDSVSNEFTGILPAENRSDNKKFVPFGIDGRTNTNLPLTYNTTKLRIIPIEWENKIGMRVDAIILS